MEPDRFDDVDYEIVEAPEPPPRRPRLRRWALAAIASVLTAGALAAAASALTSSGDNTATKPRQHLSRTAEGMPVSHNGSPCHHGGTAYAPMRADAPAN